MGVYHSLLVFYLSVYSAVCLKFKDGFRAMEVVVVGRSEQRRVDLSTLVENESLELLILLQCCLSSYFFNNLKFPVSSSYLLPTYCSHFRSRYYFGGSVILPIVPLSFSLTLFSLGFICLFVCLSCVLFPSCSRRVLIRCLSTRSFCVLEQCSQFR